MVGRGEETNNFWVPTDFLKLKEQFNYSLNTWQDKFEQILFILEVT